MFNKGIFSFKQYWTNILPRAEAAAAVLMIPSLSFPSTNRFFISVNDSDNSYRINKSWCSAVNRDFFINLPAVSSFSNSVLTPRSNLSCERKFFSDEAVILRTSSLNNYSNSFKASNKWRLNSPIISISSNSVWWIDAESNNFDFDLALFWLANNNFFEDWVLLKLFDDYGLLSILTHWIFLVFYFYRLDFYNQIRFICEYSDQCDIDYILLLKF